MFLLDFPYVSDIVKKNIHSLQIPVVETSAAIKLLQNSPVCMVSVGDLEAHIQQGGKVYTNSENALDTVIKAAKEAPLAQFIEVCKDKASFREEIRSLYPNFFFQRVPIEEIENLDIESLPIPFIIKPTRGFYSLGVHPVLQKEDWPAVVQAIKEEAAALNAEYPEGVVDGGEYVIEECALGEEYAVDVYYDENGKAVILQILHHVFPSADDVSDRLYYTSGEVMKSMLPIFQKNLDAIGECIGFKNYCMHIEARVDAQGNCIPIEANPLRFAGWCVADLTQHAWGFSPYEYYLQGKKPNWEAILEERGDAVYAMCIGDIPADVDRRAITGINYDGFCEFFDEVLELRKIEYVAYPLFAFVFSRTQPENFDKLKQILTADLRKFINIADSNE